MLEALYEDGQYEKALKELQRARALYPENLTLLEWQAVFAADENRYLEALEMLDRVLAADPERPFALREKATVLQGLGRFEDSLELFQRIGPDGKKDTAYYFDTAICYDRLGRIKDADKNFAKAARIDPEGFTPPLRLSREEFEALVSKALEGIPREFRSYLENVTVVVEDYPRPTDPDPFILGLYEGIPRTERGEEHRDNPDRVTIFKRNLEVEFPEREVLEEEIRKTVIHEIAHHFGIEEENMGAFA